MEGKKRRTGVSEPKCRHMVRAMKSGGAPFQPTYNHQPKHPQIPASPISPVSSTAATDAVPSAPSTAWTFLSFASARRFRQSAQLWLFLPQWRHSPSNLPGLFLSVVLFFFPSLIELAVFRCVAGTSAHEASLAFVIDVYIGVAFALLDSDSTFRPSWSKIQPN